MASNCDSACCAGLVQAFGSVAQRLSGTSTWAVSSRPAATIALPSGLEQVLTACDSVQVLQFCLPSEILKIRASAPTFGSSADGLVKTDVLDRLVNNFLAIRVSHFGKIGMDTLHDAAELGDREAVWAHLYEGASPNEYDAHGCVPIHYAAQSNDVGVYKLLQKAGADLQAVHEAQNYRQGWTPLHFAAYSGSSQVLLMLLLRGVEVNRMDCFRRTATYFAKSQDRQICLRYLKRFGGVDDTHKMKAKALDEALRHLPGDATQAAKADGSDIVWDSSTDAADMFVQGMVAPRPTNLGEF